MHGVCGFDQPARRDSASEHGAPQACPGGLSLLARDPGVDHPARRYSASGCGPRGRPACPGGLSDLARTAGVDQPARRDSASEHVVRGFYEPARRYSASGCGPRGRPAGPAGLGLRAKGSTSLPCGLSLRALGYTSLPSRTEPPGSGRGGQPAGTEGLGLPARCPWVLPAFPGDSACGRGPRRSTSRPGGKQPPEAALRGSVSSAVLSLRALCCGVDQPARRDTSSCSGPRCSTSWAGALSLHSRGLWVRPDSPAD